MLENLNERVCVSRHRTKNQDRWACYEPFEVRSISKRLSWKRLTGLLSTSEMQCYLDKSYCSIEVSKKFTSISA